MDGGCERRCTLEIFEVACIQSTSERQHSLAVVQPRGKHPVEHLLPSHCSHACTQPRWCKIATLTSYVTQEAQLDLKILTDQGAALQAKICGNAEEPLEDERSLASLLARHRQIASWAPLLSEVSDDVQSVGKWCDDLVKKAQLFDESIARGEIRPDFLEWVKELETMNQGARMAARGSTIIVGWNEIPEAVEVLERMGYRQIMEEQGVWK